MPLTCLIAAHDPWFIQLIRLYAVDLGFEIKQAFEGEDVLPAIYQEPPSVLLISSNLPGKIKFYDIVLAIRSDPNLHQFPILVVHPQSSPMNGFNKGFIEAELHEPVSYDDFRKTLKKVGLLKHDPVKLTDKSPRKISKKSIEILSNQRGEKKREMESKATRKIQSQKKLPRWRGFNLLDLFTIHSTGDFREEDFQWIADWGFNFVRIPACYTLWINGENVYDIYEPMLEKIDRVIQLGQTYGIHICFNFHRAPGYSVNPERVEPYNLWKDEAALEAFCFHWQTFARRYRGISSDQLSFNLVNEPARVDANKMSREDHERVVRQTTNAIHAIDPERLVIADGLNWANEPLPELIDLNIAQSCRAYQPMGISHYKARWVGGENWAEPTWPGVQQDGVYWDRKKLLEHYQPWIELAKQGIGVHCGEGGAFSYTPHSVLLSWYRDVLEILTEHNIGYALWNFRGAFGILDSGRKDVKYIEWHGHQLDGELLKLLQEF